MKIFYSQKITFIFYIFLFSVSCKNSEYQNQWAKTGGGENYDGGRALVLDSDGNIYVIGRFQGSASFDEKKIIGQGDDGIFLLKYNTSGKLLWAKELGGKKEDSGYSIDIDNKNNIYIAGYFEDTSFFDSHYLFSRGEYDAFLVKCNSDGKVLWAKQAGGNFNDVARGVFVNENGSCILTGFFTGTLFLDENFSLQSDGFHEDIFIVKYNADGKIIWAKRAGGKNDDRAISITSSRNGKFFLSGYFKDSANFDNIQVKSNGQSDAFVAMYNADGNALWAKHFGGAGIDEARGIKSDDNNNVFVTGFFVQQLKFENSNVEFTSMGERDIFIAKFDENGNLLWAKRAGGNGLDEGSAVNIGNSGDCIVTGFFGANADFEEQNFSTAGGNDIFIAHYSSDGKLLCFMQAGSSGYDEGRSVASDGKGNFILTGNYLGSLKIGNMILPESKGDGDMFLAKIPHTCKKD